jgi:UDP-2,3-diacylglucosamine pyrophosphatase LpxH
MKIVISDFHLGSPLFKFTEVLISLFDRPDVEEIYILGDILDFWEQNVDKTVERNKRLIDYINNSSKVKIILKGNHDPKIEKLKDIFPNVEILERYETEICGLKTIMVHGDEFDSSYWWTKVLYPFHYCLQRLGINIKKVIRGFIHFIYMVWQGTDKNDLVFPAEKKIFNKYSKDYKVILAGHSHVAKICKKPEALYVNCGSVLSDGDYISIEGSKVRIKKLIKD